MTLSWPEVHLLLYRGVLAPHACWRRQIVGFGRSPASEEAAARRAERGASRYPRSWVWAALMRRAVLIDGLACPRCGGWLRLTATVEDPAVVGTILAPLGLLHPAGSPSLPRRRPPCALPPPPTSHPSQSRGWTLPRGRRRKIVADDWPGGGITNALRAVLSAPATPPPGPAGAGPV